MEPSPACIALIKQYEGCCLTAYQDAAGFWTIGWGHKGPEVHAGLTWDQLTADAQLLADVNSASEQMQALVKVPLTQGQFDALTDFTFNLGSGRLQHSTLLLQLNERNYNEVPAQLAVWVHSGSSILPGLVSRRTSEINLWNGEGV